MSKPENTFRVPRTCTRKSGSPNEQGSHPLEGYRNLPAYVLLGDPGAGKTSAFRMESEASGGKYVRARDFADFEPKVEDRDKTLFIDALDEMRADGGGGKTPLDHIRAHLERLGCPHFRLSCREADWLGESDRADLNRVSPQGEVVALHLDPLSDKDVVDILRHKKIPDPQAFIRKADENKLGQLLCNPQTLELLVDATGGKEWPKSRKEIYEMACTQLARENSKEHRQAKRDKSISSDALLDAAGYLSAIHLLSGIAGYALDEDAGDMQHFNLDELATQNLPLLEALKTNLFQRDNEEQRIPVHRSVAEFLGARYLSRQIDTHGLPFGRVLALITGADGGIASDLRGLAAWLSVHCICARTELIKRDPLGVVLYGDVRFFPVAAKQQILNALRNEAQQYPWFRSTDWTSSPFGALGTTDMAPEFSKILASPSRTEADQALLECVLDAIRYGEPMRNLADALEDIARDDSYLTEIRVKAVRGIMRSALNYGEILSKLAQDIRENTVKDSDDEILGALLSNLYPRFIKTAQILDFLYLSEKNGLPYIFSSFWEHDFLAQTKANELPLLLDQLVHKHLELKEHLYEYTLHRVIGALLARGVETHGDSITDKRLYDWLGVGLDENGDPMLDTEHAKRIASWFADRPERYKALIEYGVSLCSEHEAVWHCISLIEMRFFDSPPPSDIGIWYLEKASTEQENKFAEGYFNEAASLLKQQGGQSYLTFPALEFIESWVNAYPSFQPWLEPFISEPLGDWQQNRATRKRERTMEREKKIRERVEFIRLHIDAVRNGDAPPQLLHDLARAYGGLLFEAVGKTPDERLNDFLGGDKELIAAVHAGFRSVLDRNDLPTIKEVVDLELKGKMHYIRAACLVGMDELYQSSPTVALQLNDAVLSLLVAFWFSHGAGEAPGWIGALVNNRPELVAEALLEYALPLLRAGKEHISGLSRVVHDKAYSEVACIALPRLLEGFPLRARKPQLKNALDPLLKAAWHLIQEELASIVMHKMNLESMDAAQRVYWLACGMLLFPERYSARLFKYIGKSKAKREDLASFLRERWERGFSYAGLTENVNAQLIGLLATDCSPDRPKGVQWVSPAMETAKLVQSFISTLGGNPGEAATSELERLLSLPDLVHWQQTLRGALHDQRIARRKASFRRLDVKAIVHTLANQQPANAADLAALTLDHLRDIARKIRDGSTNDYMQYWSYDEHNQKLVKPKPENDCRDALLSDLNERLGKLGINAEREGNYADGKRADIKVLFDGSNGFNVPIEIKKDTHDDLWRAIHEQLIPKYVRDPGANGYGIYLVFWFGGKGMKPPADGKKLRSAAELEERLRQELTQEKNHRIQVCVIDCALP